MKKAIISRTFIKTVVSALVFTTERKVESREFIIPSASDTIEKAEKYLAKHVDLLNGEKLVTVDKVDKLEELRGMYVDDFIAAGQAVAERSKDTRGMISRTVSNNIFDILYLSPDRKVEKTVGYAPIAEKDIEKYARKNCKIDGHFITVENIRKVETLVVMDENEFLRLSRPMADRFTLIED